MARSGTLERLKLLVLLLLIQPNMMRHIASSSLWLAKSFSMASSKCMRKGEPL